MYYVGISKEPVHAVCPEEGVRFQAALIIGICELPKMSAGNWAQGPQQDQCVH